MSQHPPGPTAIPEGCPLDRMLRFLARAWTAHVVFALGGVEAAHFGALRRALPGRVSARVLAARLKELQQAGLVSRRQERTGRREARYALTPDGRKLDALLRRLEHALGDLPVPERLPDRT